MKVVVDCRPFVRNVAGTAMFLKLAIKAWKRQYPDHELVLLAPKEFKPEIGSFSDAQVLIKPWKMFGRFVPNFIWFLFYLPILIFIEKPDLYFSPSPSLPFFLPPKTKSLIIVHDVVNLELKNTMELKNKIQNIFLFGRSVKRSDFIWTNSNYTADKVNQYFPKRKSKTLFSGLTVDADVFKMKKIDLETERSLRTRYGVEGNFLLFVGTVEPRKNLNFLLKIMPELVKQTGVKLLIVGAKGWKESALYSYVERNPVLRDNVLLAGFVPEDDLVNLYNIANCFVSTSLNEGFGMPQLEAIMCRCPVVTAHNSAMIEVVSGRGITIDGWDETEWVETISCVVNGPKENFYAENLNLGQYEWPFIIKGLVEYMEVNPL